jgi:hypothetical protein
MDITVKELTAKFIEGITMQHDQITINYEDQRYPTIIIQDEDGMRHGYSVNLSDGTLHKVCLCAAYCESECVCGYEWV